jgi:hypothetical protein
MTKIVLGEPPINLEKKIYVPEENTLYFFQTMATFDNTQSIKKDKEHIVGHHTYTTVARNIKGSTLRVYCINNGSVISIDAESFLRPGEINKIMLDIKNNEGTVLDKELCEKIKKEGPLFLSQRDSKEEERQERKRHAVNLPLIHAARKFLYLLSKVEKQAADAKIPDTLLNKVRYAKQDFAVGIRTLTDSILLLQRIKQKKIKIKAQEMLKMRADTGELINYEKSKEYAKDQILFYTNQVVKSYNETKVFFDENKTIFKPIFPSLFYKDSLKEKKKNDSLEKSSDKGLDKSLDPRSDSNLDKSLGQRSDSNLDKSLGQRSDSNLDKSLGQRLDSNLDKSLGQRSDSNLDKSLDQRSDSTLDKSLDKSSDESVKESVDRVRRFT